MQTDRTCASSVPVSDFADQERSFKHAFEILNNAVSSRAFPGAAAAVTHHGKLVALKAVGCFTYDTGSPRITSQIIFDLASVSKVLATTSMAMILCERGLLALDTPIAGIVPEFVSGSNASDFSRRRITPQMLLAHSSGLPAYERLYQRANTREELLSEALSIPLKYGPGTDVEYSDIGFVILGMALERIAEEPLDRFCEREVFGRLGMINTVFNPRSGWKTRIAPTADDSVFRKRIIQGEVQDENASVMGGVAGHAGVFSTAGDVAIFAQAMLNGGSPLVTRETLNVFTRRETAPPGTSRALGWDTPSVPSQSGKYFSLTSFGHLGYTGTSLWIDPERQLSITLLTNRTWPDCTNQLIKEVRPRFHDAVIDDMGAAG